jgi:SWI/SNF-related matrix-associated actin-dependent regulator 1 of chromatin subfamily A
MNGKINGNVYPLGEFRDRCKDLPKGQVPRDELINFVSVAMVRDTSLVPDWGEYPEILREQMLGSQHTAILDMIQLYKGRILLSAQAGTGKTLMSSVVAKYYGGWTLVITPGNSLQDYKEGALKWAGLELTEAKNKKFVRTAGQNVICSYETICRHPELRNIMWDVLIVDESHYIKNREAARTKLIMPMIRRTQVVIVVSATPQTKDPSQLYTQIVNILPAGVIGSFYDFTTRYLDGKMIYEFGRQVWKLGKTRFTQELNLLLGFCMIRMDREMGDVERLRRFKVVVPVGDGYTRKMKNLREQMTDTMPETEAFQITLELARLAGLAKLSFASRWCLNWLAEHPEEKLIIWVISVQVCDELHNFFMKNRVPSVIVNGGTSTKGGFRHDIIKSLASRSDKKYRVGILTYKTSCLGINLTPACHTSVALEISFDPTESDQSEKKLERLGQDRQVMSHFMICELETVHLMKIQRKVNINSQVLDGKSTFLQFDKSTSRECMLESIGLKKNHIDRILIGVTDEDSAGSILKKIGRKQTKELTGLETLESPYVNENTIVYDSVLYDAEPVCQLIPRILPSNKKHKHKPVF